jgi:hypothetical protein
VGAKGGRGQDIRMWGWDRGWAASSMGKESTTMNRKRPPLLTGGPPSEPLSGCCLSRSVFCYEEVPKRGKSASLLRT